MKSYVYYRPLAWYETEDKKDKAHMIQQTITKKLVDEFGLPTDANPGFKVAFQYFYTQTPKEGKKPRITVCFISTEEAASIGISICSFKEEPDKLVGQTIALGRASKALLKKENMYTVGEDTVDLIFMCSDFDHRHVPTFKGMYMPHSDGKFRYPRMPHVELG